jgi:hypothetical protein
MRTRTGYCLRKATTSRRRALEADGKVTITSRMSKRSISDGSCPGG